jgi:hypothetical protein
MSEQPRNWDKELADIDRAMARQQPRPEIPASKPAPSPPAAQAAPLRRGATATTWLRLLLAVLLAVAMPFWPYGHGCGVGLFAYLAAAGVVVLGGVWAAVASWQTRRPLAHVVALLVTLWGLGLVAAEVLPRVGYAKQGVRWTCG